MVSMMRPEGMVMWHSVVPNMFGCCYSFSWVIWVIGRRVVRLKWVKWVIWRAKISSKIGRGLGLCIWISLGYSICIRICTSFVKSTMVWTSYGISIVRQCSRIRGIISAIIAWVSGVMVSVGVVTIVVVVIVAIIV